MTTVTIPQAPDAAIADLIGTSYETLHCWALARTLYQRGVGMDLPWSQQLAAREFVELWYRQDSDTESQPPAELPQPWDLCLFEIREQSAPHVGIVFPGGQLAHSTAAHGVHLDRLSRYLPYLYQLSRPRALLREHLPSVPKDTPPRLHPDYVLVRMLRSPILGRDGQKRESWQHVAPGHSLAQIIPKRDEPYGVWLNSELIAEEDLATTYPGAGHEVLVSSFWGDPISTTGLILLGAQLLLGVGLTLLSTYLQQPRNVSTDEDIERTHTYQGIRSNNRAGGTVERDYDWRTIYRGWDKIYAGVSG